MKKTLTLIHPSGKVAQVKVGFSWPAFFLGPLWAIVKRLWLHFLILIMVAQALNFFMDHALSQDNLPSALLSIAMSLSYPFACGFYGNRWLLKTLLKRGYVIPE